MGNLQGTRINKIDGGNGRLSDINGKTALLVSPVDTTGISLATGEAVRLLQTRDIEDFGVNESFDANGKVLVHYQIDEFFRLAPEAELYFLPVDKDATIATAVSSVLQVLRKYNQIQGIGFFGFKNQTLDTASGLVDSLQIDLVAEAKSAGILIDTVMIEGGGAGSLALNNYPDLTTKAAENISVVIAQDPDVAKLDAAYASFAAVGSVLGMYAVRRLSENIGSTDIQNRPEDKKSGSFYSLTDAGLNRWVNAGLSTGQKIEELSNTDISDLVAKGYILAGSYIGASGMYFSGSPTCTSPTSKYSTIENNSVWNGAARLIRESLAPYIKSKVKRDPDTGFIRSTTIAHWEQVANKACIERLSQEDEISGGDVYIDPKQTPNEDTPLKISVTIVSDGIVHTFDVDLSLI